MVKHKQDIRGASPGSHRLPLIVSWSALPPSPPWPHPHPPCGWPPCQPARPPQLLDNLHHPPPWEPPPPIDCILVSPPHTLSPPFWDASQVPDCLFRVERGPSGTIQGSDPLALLAQASNMF